MDLRPFAPSVIPIPFMLFYHPVLKIQASLSVAPPSCAFDSGSADRMLWRNIQKDILIQVHPMENVIHEHMVAAAHALYALPMNLPAPAGCRRILSPPYSYRFYPSGKIMPIMAVKEFAYLLH